MRRFDIPHQAGCISNLVTIEEMPGCGTWGVWITAPSELPLPAGGSLNQLLPYRLLTTSIPTTMKFAGSAFITQPLPHLSVFFVEEGELNPLSIIRSPMATLVREIMDHVQK